MSRCFPYPPPGCSRNGATYEALIESIKLQKETDKAKAERKKEKRARKERKNEKRVRKEKKENEKRKDEEKGKLQNNPNECQPDPHKVLQSSVDFKEAHNKRTEPSIEPLEKSDLTEEHGQPISSHKPSYSSDSTQNSNKRKRDDAIFPDGTGSHGKPIKIRLLKKHKGPDFSKETSCSNSGRTDPPSLHGADALNTCKLSTSGNTDPSVPSASGSVNGHCLEDRTLLVSSNRKTGCPATSGRENDAVQGIVLSQTKSTPSFERLGTKNNDPQELHFSRKQSASSSGRPVLPSSPLEHEILSSNLNKTGLPVPSQSKKSNVEVLHFSRQQPVRSNGRPVLPPSHLEHEIPSPASNVPPAPSVQGFRSGREQLAPSSGIPVLPPSHLKHGISSSGLNKIKSSASGKRSIGEITVPGNSVPTRFEKKMKASISEIPFLGNSNVQDVGPTRFEKKMQKKHTKYEKLIGSWVPPVLHAQLPDADDDQDWLTRSDKVARSYRDVVETLHEPAASSLWQPCARFLAEADIHVLPYTVPF